jgi:hypothetical protein
MTPEEKKETAIIWVIAAALYAVAARIILH